jgi:hypothetical protein
LAALALSGALWPYGNVFGQSSTSMLTVADFETGNTSQLKIQKGASDSIIVVTAPVRSGTYAARTLLRAEDRKVSRGQRAEFVDAKTTILMNTDYWYGLSVFLPADFTVPTASNVVLVQWHTQAAGPSPVLAIRVQGGDWMITSDATGTQRSIARIPIEKNRWADWVVHVKWSATLTGYWTIWKDAVRVVDESGIVTQYPESLGPYAKFGQYHSVRGVGQNVAYFDEYRVAGPGAGYEVVAPGGGSQR